MYILGLNAYHGDASACLFEDENLILAIEEERFRRIKHWAGFPTEAVRACLAEGGIDISQVDHISISRNPSANMLHKITHTLTKIKNWGSVVDRFMNARKVTSVKSVLAEEFGMEESSIKAEVHQVEHHRAHLASSFFASPYKEASLLSIDGFGDFTSTMTGFGSGNDIDVFDSVIYPNSVGGMYTAFTQYLGFMNYGDEYKVMGLAPYGQPSYVDKIADVIELTNNGLFKLNSKYFRYSKEAIPMTWEDGYPTIGTIYTEELINLLGPARKKGEPLTQYHKDIAASIQRLTERVIFHILKKLYEKTSCDTLCVAGGVAQNSVANGKIYDNTPFKHIYMPPAATDAGTSIGAALWVYNQELKHPRIPPMLFANTGCRYSDDYIQKMLEQQKLSYEKLSEADIREAVCNCLIDGGVVGWYKGRSEFGPRALGYRSILADPRRKDARDILNLKIKKRESFRPFAPSILKEHVKDYFELSHDVPFMEKVFVIKPEKREVLPAVTHVDGTGRLQSVFRDQNPKYYDLINHFYQKTGVPVVLNTSFNENEPIVNKPEEALDCYLRTSMDMLVLENYVVKRSNNE